MTAAHPAHLEPSELGTKAFWDATYAHDLNSHSSTPSHTGQDWFSDVDASSKILRYLTSPQLDIQNTSFLDLGTGNAEMLFLLREEGGFEGVMLGVDYSNASVQFCRRRMAALQEEVSEVKEIAFQEWDILHSAPRKEWCEGWDVVLDKGTFDAISLSDEVDEAGRRVCEGYKKKVEGLVKCGGYFVVTSCNWTEEELKGWFEGENLEVAGRVDYPVFRFGGKTGQSISTVCFKKKKQ